MPVCPACGDEFEDGVAVCPDDGTELVDDGDEGVAATVAAVPAEALLGTFHPRMAVEVRRLLELRGQAHRVVEVDDVRTQLHVPNDARDDLRTELLLGWEQLLRVLPPDDAPTVLGTGTSTHPGWHDVPQRVAAEQDEALADA